MNRSAGQSLVEIIVSLGMVALLVMGVVVATTTSLKNSQAGRLRSQAVQLAQEGIELTRVLRDKGWSDFQALNGLWCLDKAGIWTLAQTNPCPINIDTVFSRGATFTWDGANERMSVLVVVAWTDASVARQTTIETYMTDWK